MSIHGNNASFFAPVVIFFFVFWNIQAEYSFVYALGLANRDDDWIVYSSIFVFKDEWIKCTCFVRGMNAGNEVLLLRLYCENERIFCSAYSIERYFNEDNLRRGRGSDGLREECIRRVIM